MATATASPFHRIPLSNRLVLSMLASRSVRWLLPGLAALRFIGRRSGRVVTVPVAVVTGGPDVIVLVGRSAAKRWWRNFCGGHRVDVLVDGQWRPGSGEVVTPDRLEYPRLLAGYRTENPHVRADTREPLVHIRPLASPKSPSSDAAGRAGRPWPEPVGMTDRASSSRHWSREQVPAAGVTRREQGPEVP